MRRGMVVGMMMTLAVAIGGLAAVALAGPDKPIASVKSLAGDWRAVGGASAAAIRITADGSYEGTAASGDKAPGKITVTAGKGTFKSTMSEGKVTLSEEGGKDVLTFARADGRGSARLQRVR